MMLKDKVSEKTMNKHLSANSIGTIINWCCEGKCKFKLENNEVSFIYTNNFGRRNTLRFKLYTKEAIIEVKKDLLEEIKKKHKEHLKRRDGDGFPVCPVLEQKSMRIAPKREWFGTEKTRQQAIKSQKRMDKLIRCKFCDFVEDLKKKVLK